MSLIELAERCEKATGPSYELDCAIWDAIYPGERDERFRKISEEGPLKGRLGSADRNGYVQPLRAFTASLDAAMSLAGDAWDRIEFGRYEKDRSRFWADLGDAQAEDCASVVLAICAAALRARAQQTGERQ